MSYFVGYTAQAGTPEIQTDNSTIFVIPSQVVAGATATNVTYNMSVTQMTPSDNTSAVKYDYVFDYNLDASGAANFCNAFDVSGANPYDSGKNNACSVTLSAPSDVKDILLAAFADASAQAGQAPAAGAPTKANLSGSDTIDSTLTSILQQFVNAYDSTSFDGAYYSAAIGIQAGVSTAEVTIDLDDDTGVSGLKRGTAADTAVAVGGAIRTDAKSLALQIPASNMRLYEDASSSKLPTSLLLKGGDTVVIAFQVTLDNPQAACALPSGDVTNVDHTPNSHPDQLEAATLNVDIGAGPSAIRPVEIAIRLHMPGSSNKLEGLRAPVA